MLACAASKESAHSSSVSSVAFNEDGDQIVSGSDDKTIKVWGQQETPSKQTAEGKKAAAEKAAEKEAAARAAQEATEKAAAAAAAKDVAAKEVAAPAGEEALRVKLAELNMTPFADKLVKVGFDTLEMLVAMDDAELSAVGMGAGHIKKVKGLREAAAAKHAAPEPPKEDKFFAKKLVMGQAAEAALGLVAALGLSDASLGAQLQRGEQAIVDEFAQHGSAEDKANLQYVLYGTALKDEDLPAHVQKQMRDHSYHGGVLEAGDFDHGHGGKTLADFVNHEYSRLAQLLRPHVLALRMYTSSSYPCFNRPLRDGQKPHPFAMAVYYLADGLKKLRAVAAKIDPEGFTQEVVLWRGMQDLALDKDAFTSRGGTELAPMSTSRSQSVAFKYAASQSPLVFKYKTRGLGRGCSIGYLSLYPKAIHSEENLMKAHAAHR